MYMHIIICTKLRPCRLNFLRLNLLPVRTNSLSITLTHALGESLHLIPTSSYLEQTPGCLHGQRKLVFQISGGGIADKEKKHVSIEPHHNQIL